jgi:hypothetical protein
MIRSGYHILSSLDSIEGNFKEGFANFKKYILYSDSLNNEENTRKTVQAQMQYEFDKKEAITKAEQDKKDVLIGKEKQKQKIVIYSVSFGLLMVLAFTIFILRNFRQKQKANTEILKQKEIIEEKQKEILDSIRYAKRIQQALLPTEPYIEKQMKKHLRK